MLDGLTEFDATFPAREARAVALERSTGTPIAVALEQLRTMRASNEILLLGDGSGTTRQHRGREQTVVQITERLAATRVQPLSLAATISEIDRLDQELCGTGGRLSDEQRNAIQLGCGEHQLVMIEGHAGTGKSTTLTGIARVHQACGQEIIVTSTAALAAERLASELTEAGVNATAYSTAGLQAAITAGRAELTTETTVIHDEAALASTREQQHLLHAIESAGARLITVGDPQQNQPVGAGGLWERIATATRHADAYVQLTRNQTRPRPTRPRRPSPVPGRTDRTGDPRLRRPKPHPPRPGPRARREPGARSRARRQGPRQDDNRDRPDVQRASRRAQRPCPGDPSAAS